MSFRDIVVSKIEATKSDLEVTIEKNIDEIKDYHVKNIDYLNMKISAITSKNFFLL